MAYSSNKNKKVNVQYFQDIAETYRKNRATTSTVDVISFAEAQWGLGQKLFPVQKFILKTLYGLELDNTVKTIVVPDEMNMKEIGRFTESEFMDFLIDTGRTNLRDYTPGKGRRELVLNCGRRSSKCQAEDAPIYTTEGNITCGELLRRIGAGEKIGLLTLEHGMIRESYGIKAEDNGERECVRVETYGGYSETATTNHPFLACKGRSKKPEFIRADQLERGDWVAVPRVAPIFGKGGIGTKKAMILGMILACAKPSQMLTYSLSNGLIDANDIAGIVGNMTVENSIPECILRGNEDEIAAFLCGFFTVAGQHSHSETGIVIDFETHGESICQGMQRLLLQMGILCKIGEFYTNRHQVMIADRHGAEEFLKIMDRFPEERIRMLEIVLQIAGPVKDVLDLEVGFTKEKLEDARWWIEREHTWRLKYNSGTGTTWLNLNEDIKEYENGVVWFKVWSVESVGKRKTVAIEVPDTHIIVNSIISHNSSMAAIISLYESYRLLKMGNPQAYYGMPNGQEISICTTSTSEENASILFNLMKSYCLNCSFLKDKVVNKSREFYSLATEYDTTSGADPTIFLICGGARSSSIRGHNNLVVIMDEAAFFPTSGDGNGDALYQALTPSIATFTKEHENGEKIGEGKIILLSSPFGKSGVFYRKYMESFDFQENMLMYNMYTAMVNPKVDSSILRDEKKRNPSLFECEYGAKFSDTVSSWMDEKTLGEVIDKNRPVNPKSGRGGIEYYMGIDYAGKNDGAAVSIVHKENNVIVLDYADVYYGSDSDVWENESGKTYESANRLFADKEIIPIEKFADEIKRLNTLFPIKYGWFDQFNGYGLMEMLVARGLEQFEMKSLTNAMNMQMYQLVKELICSKMIIMPNHPILVPEILTLEESKNGSKVIVEAPQRRGFHDDITDSFVEACFACHSSGSAGFEGKVIGRPSDFSIASGHAYNSYMARKAKQHGIQDKRPSGSTLYSGNGSLWI